MDCWVASGWVSTSPQWIEGVCGATGGGGGHPKRGHRRVQMPVIDLRQHDDELALLLLEADDG